MSSLLLGSRAGLVVGESAVDASRAAALHLAIYKRSLKLLSGAAALSEEQASRLVSALETELSGMVSPVDISEVRSVLSSHCLGQPSGECRVAEVSLRAAPINNGASERARHLKNQAQCSAPPPWDLA